MAVKATGKALEDFAAHGPRVSLRDAVVRLVPSLAAMEARGESWKTIADVCRASGLPIRPAYLRSLYKAAVRAASKREE